MKKLSIFCFSFAILMISIFGFCQAPKDYEQSRIHYFLKLDNGSSIEYTTISKGVKETETTKTFEFTTLLDLKESGLWIVKKYSVFNKKDDGAFIKTEFIFLDSGESLTIESASDKDEPKKENIKIMIGKKDKSFQINKDELKDGSQLIELIKENFSQNFCEKIEKFKNLSVEAHKEKFTSFAIPPFTFFPLFGRNDETDINKHSEQVIQIKINEHRHPDIIYCNCDFDKQFGYPCSPEEVPAKNPKVLVIEKKQ